METKKNVGIWIRVSTEMQVQDDSPEHHEKRAKLYAEAKNWNVITVYRLDAMSGKSIMDYPETKRMLADIKNGTITGLVFSKLARLARNTKELLEISELFQESKADLVSLAEAIDTSSPAGRLFFTIISAMAQWEREEIASRVQASVPIRASMGKPLGGQATFGYKWEGKELLIDENEAPIRKLLYDIFLQNKRKKGTANELNKLGYRTRNGSLFSGTTIERLLKDPTAKGTRIANYTKSLGEGKNWVIKPQSEWVQLPCEPIVDESIWNECNLILEQQTKKRVPNGPKTVHLLSGYVYCSCGTKMYVYTESPIYKCTTCKRKIAVSDLDEIFHEQLKSFLLTDSDLESINDKSNSILNQKESLLKTVQNEYDKLLKRTENQMNLRVDGEISKEEFARFYSPTQLQLRQLELQIPELQAEIDYIKIQSFSSDIILSDAKELYNNWKTLPYNEKRSIVETITQRIEIDAESINISLSYLPTPTQFQNGVKREHNIIPALPFYDMKFQVPNSSRLIKNPQRLADHLKNQRIKLNLIQKDVAKIFNVSTDTITNWENNRGLPQINFYPKLIEFLGLFPFEIDTSTLQGKMKEYRYINGLSQKKLGEILGVDASTVGSWEKGEHEMPKFQQTKMLNIIFAVN